MHMMLIANTGFEHNVLFVVLETLDSLTYLTVLTAGGRRDCGIYLNKIKTTKTK